MYDVIIQPLVSQSLEQMGHKVQDEGGSGYGNNKNRKRSRNNANNGNNGTSTGSSAMGRGENEKLKEMEKEYINQTQLRSIRLQQVRPKV